jgi:hypothetical protein
MSRPTTLPEGPTAFASTCKNPPGAAPKSNTFCPGFTKESVDTISSILKAERARKPSFWALRKKESLGW